MVSPRRYLAHHKEEADRIRNLLSQFGSSGEVAGFWCVKGTRTTILDCIRCEYDNFCPNSHPPLERDYNPDGSNPWRGDMALRFLMTDRPLGNRDDWMWLQHPEIREA